MKITVYKKAGCPWAAAVIGFLNEIRCESSHKKYYDSPGIRQGGGRKIRQVHQPNAGSSRRGVGGCQRGGCWEAAGKARDCHLRECRRQNGLSTGELISS